MTNVDETKTTTSFEKLLFGFTRVFAIGGSLVALVAVVILLFSLFESSNKKTYVSFSDLRPRLQQEKVGSEETVSPPEIKIQIPDNVKKYLFPENEQILYGWIESLDKRGQEDFLENLSSIIAEAEKNNENVINIAYDYKTAKLRKLRSEKQSETQSEKYERIAAEVGALFGLVLFIALMSLILVMLAVERNTRKTVNS